MNFVPPFCFLELFGSLTSQSLLEYVGISHWLWLHVSDTQNEGFMVSLFLLLVFSRRWEHCNYHLQLSWTWLITTFLPCHLLPFVHVRCLFLHKKYKDHCQSFCGVADEVCPPGLRPWMDYEKHMAAKHALSSMLFVRVLSRYICASIPRHPPPHPMVMGLYSGAPVSPVSPPPPVVWVVVGGGGGRSCICMYMYVFVYDYMICI